MNRQTTIPTTLVQRIILERDLTDTRSLVYTADDGTEVVFDIRSITAAERQEIRDSHNLSFPTPPVVQGSLGSPQFDLQDEAFQEKLHEWNRTLSRSVLAAALGVNEGAVTLIEQTLPREFVNKLFATIELLNGIQSDPLVDLVREALWAPEVLTWLETATPDADNIKITDTPLYREMDTMIGCGLTLDQWEKLSPRHKIMYINFHTYKQAREGYITTMAEKSAKEKANRGIR